MNLWRRRSHPRARVPALPPLGPLPVVPVTVPSEAAPAIPTDLSDEPAPLAASPVADARPTTRWRDLTAVARAVTERSAEVRALLAGAAYSRDAWDRFRRDFPVRPPPGGVPDAAEEPLVVLVDASRAAPFLIRATLRSLQDQSFSAWRAIVVAPPAMLGHPVAGLATTDPRIAFVAVPELPKDAAHVVAIDAGTALDPQALAWLVFAVRRTRAPALFADHDHGVIDPVIGPVRDDPMLYGAYDPHALAEVDAPALVIAERRLLAGTIPPDGDTLRRGLLVAAAAIGGVPHLARALATRLALPLIARDGRPSEDDDVSGRLGPPPMAPRRRPLPPEFATRIAIVIPTRDGAALLRQAIETLRATARDAARLEFVVVDNRSVEPETIALFASLERNGIARIVRFDAPFNYSLACNLGMAASDAPVVAFINNDIAMLAPGWDDMLVEALADPKVGAVGARLLYPNGTVQHAGVAFGFGPGGAEHEGRDAAGDESGPGGRYVTSHAVASVTGAFLAVRRADLDAVGGYDADRLAIAHSDVDLCLKLRERGLTILYCPAIEALHYEGATRGRNETRAAIAWDEGERADLIARWGGALGEDIGVSPYWVRGGQPFAGLVEPPLGTILDHLDATARPDPWVPVRPA